MNGGAYRTHRADEEEVDQVAAALVQFFPPLNPRHFSATRGVWTDVDLQQMRKGFKQYLRHLKKEGLV